VLSNVNISICAAAVPLPTNVLKTARSLLLKLRIADVRFRFHWMLSLRIWKPALGFPHLGYKRGQPNIRGMRSCNDTCCGLAAPERGGQLEWRLSWRRQIALDLTTVRCARMVRKIKTSLHGAGCGLNQDHERSQESENVARVFIPKESMRRGARISSGVSWVSVRVIAPLAPADVSHTQAAAR
jgi:hypothetical protein